MFKKTTPCNASNEVHMIPQLHAEKLNV